MSLAPKVLVPQYYQSFSCIGSACEDTCCSGWQITIDKESYQKYEDEYNLGVKSSLFPHLKKIENSSSSENFAEVIMTESDSSCPLLSQEKLCTLHSKRGEEYLSNLCITYPRVSNVIDDNLECSLTVSCPEAARLVLLNPNGIQFEMVEVKEDERHLIANHLKTKSQKATKKGSDYFYTYRSFILEILQNKRFSIEDRLMILGYFCKQLSQLIGDKRINEIPNLIESCQQLMDNEEIRRKIHYPSNTCKQLEVTRKLIDMRLFSSVKDKRFLQCLMEALEGIHYTGNELRVGSLEQYRAAYQEFFIPFLNHSPYILENYLINYIFKNLFPVRGNIFDEYILLIIHFAIIKLLLIGMMSYHREKFNFEHVIKCIQSFSRVVEHAPTEHYRFLQYLKDNNLDTLEFMAALIRD